MKKILWCITGGEYKLDESIEALSTLKKVDVVFSYAGEEVSRIYHKYHRIIDLADKVIYERNQGKSSTIVMRLKRDYLRIIVAPATSNTVAKLVNGVSDTLITNIVSQGIKCGIDVRILATDSEKHVMADKIDGETFEITVREIDLENLQRLGKEVNVCKNAVELIR